MDVGAPEQEYERILLNGLDNTLGSNGKLRRLLLTHGHIDHIGAIKALVARYPDIQVAFHEGEAPYVTGGQHALMSHVTVHDCTLLLSALTRGIYTIVSALKFL